MKIATLLVTLLIAGQYAGATTNCTGTTEQYEGDGQFTETVNGSTTTQPCPLYMRIDRYNCPGQIPQNTVHVVAEATCSQKHPYVVMGDYEVRNGTDIGLSCWGNQSLGHIRPDSIQVAASPCGAWYVQALDWTVSAANSSIGNIEASYKDNGYKSSITGTLKKY